MIRGLGWPTGFLFQLRNLLALFLQKGSDALGGSAGWGNLKLVQPQMAVRNIHNGVGMRNRGSITGGHGLESH